MGTDKAKISKERRAAGQQQPGRGQPAVGQPVTKETLAREAEAEAKHAGRLQFDEHGNAIWEWSTPSAPVSAPVDERLRRLENPSLSIAEDSPTPVEIARSNPLGTIKGYDPYDSGKIDGVPPAKKKDLRKLSEWLELKKKAGRDISDDE